MAFTEINVFCLHIIFCEIFCMLKQVTGNLIDLNQVPALASQTILPPVNQPVTQSTSNPAMSAGLWLL